MADVGNLLGRPKELKTFAPDPRFVLPKCLLGLEFEYEGVTAPVFHNQELANSWDIHRDESLKEYGAEFVFRTPMFGVDAYNAIKALMDEAQTRKFRCTLRAGIHVHVDARDMETSQLIGMIILYTILEPVLFHWIGDARENSVFCVPFYKADDSLLETVAVVKSILFDEKHNARKTYQASKAFARYAALNLNALSKYGSLEFRHMKTTHNFERVVDWINILQSLKAATYKFPTSDGAILRLAKTTPPNALLSYIFGDELARKLWYPEITQHIKELGIPTARDLVLYGLALKEWDLLEIPDGEHRGFKKYLEELKKEEDPLQYHRTAEDPAPRFRMPRMNVGIDPEALEIRRQQYENIAEQIDRRVLEQDMQDARPAAPAAWPNDPALMPIPQPAQGQGIVAGPGGQLWYQVVGGVAGQMAAQQAGHWVIQEEQGPQVNFGNIIPRR